MKNRVLFSLLIIFFVFGCQSILEKEIFIEPSEIGVYYDVQIGNPIILNSGKHKVNKSGRLYIYKVTDTVAKINIEIFSKENKRETFSIHYWYRLNSKEIINFHMKIGNDFIDTLIIPNVFSEVRGLGEKYLSEELEGENFEKKVKENLLNNEKFSKYIITRSIIIEKKK